MSCNGCRVLRKACSANCVLRPCLESIQPPDAQAHATLFLSKFFGRTDLLNLISDAPSGHPRSALFQSLLYDAVGRTVNPVNGATGLLSTGNWHLLEAAVQTVLAGGTPASHGDGNMILEVDESLEGFESGCAWGIMMIRNQNDASDSNAVPPVNAGMGDVNGQTLPLMLGADVAVGSAIGFRSDAGEEPKLLKLFK